MLGRDALVGGDDRLAVLVLHFKAEGLPLEAFGNERHRAAANLDRELIVFKEAGEDVFGRETEGLEENGAGHLAATVDAEVENVLRVEFEVKPRAAVGNHAGREEKLPGRVRLALVVLEEDAGGTMELGNDHALRPVDDEGALLRHQRDFAHVHVVFTDFLDRLLGAVAVVNFQLNARAQAARVGQAAKLALGHVEFGLGQLVVDEAETGIPVVADDREDGGKGSLKAHGVVSGIRSYVRLQEFFVGTKLNIKQGRHFKDARTRGKALADALLFSERVRHGHSVRR